MYNSLDLPYFIENIDKDLELINLTYKKSKFNYFFINDVKNIDLDKYENDEVNFVKNIIIKDLNLSSDSEIILTKSRNNLILYMIECYNNVINLIDNNKYIEIPIFFYRSIFYFILKNKIKFKILKPRISYKFIDFLLITKDDDSYNFKDIYEIKNNFEERYFIYLNEYIQKIYFACLFIYENNIFSSTGQDLKKKTEDFINEFQNLS